LAACELLARDLSGGGERAGRRDRYGEPCSQWTAWQLGGCFALQQAGRALANSVFFPLP